MSGVWSVSPPVLLVLSVPRGNQLLRLCDQLRPGLSPSETAEHGDSIQGWLFAQSHFSYSFHSVDCGIMEGLLTLKSSVTLRVSSSGSCLLACLKSGLRSSVRLIER